MNKLSNLTGLAMYSFYAFLKLFTVAFVATALTFFTNPEAANGEYLEWQLPIKEQSDSSITIRARPVSVAIKNQDTRAQSFTGEVTVFGQIDQPFIVCAQSVDSQGFTYEASAVVPFPFSDSDKSIHLYVLRLTEQTGRMAIKESQPCPKSFNHPYPFTSGQYLRSKKPFLVVNGRVEKTHDTQHAEAILPVGLPINPVSFQSSSGGGGYNTDDYNDFKRPPFMPLPDKMVVDLMLLPTLSLPAKWRDYLPFVGMYHWLTNTKPEGVTIVVRFGDSPPFTFRISQAESRELADKLLNTRELLHWLAPRLSGREPLIQRLLELTADSDELPSPLSEEILKSLRKQLAIALEQPDTEFSLEFEYLELERTFKRQTKTQTPPGTLQLGNSESTTSPNPAVDKGSKQSDSGSQAHNNEKKQGQPGQNYPEPDNKGTDYTHNALSGDVDYYTIRLLQTKYHVSKRQVLANLDRYASEAGLRLACLDCQQSGFLLQELLPHAERHCLTCDQCQQFRPTAGTVQARQIMLQNHTQSQCTHYRGQVLGTPLMDNTLTLFRFMIRFGTEESLLDLLQQFDLPIVAEDLNQTDRNNRTVLHDLAQYTSPAVIRSFLKRFNHAGVSVLQMLLQHASPAAALSWFSLGNPEHQQLLKTLLETNPELSWDELFQQAELLQVRSLRLGWLKKEREKLEASFVGLSAPLSEPLASSSLDPEPSAPPLFVPEVVIEHSVAKDKVKDGETATHAALAARQGHTETVKARVLLNSDRSQRLRDFYSAARTGNTRLIRELLNFDPSLAREKANNGETALHKAARNGQTEAIQTLLNFDRSLAKEKHNRGWTALHVAAHNGQTEAIQILLNFDRSLAKEKDDDGNTALHMAARNGQTEAIQILLNFDRSLAKEKDNLLGWTALQYAAVKGHTGAIQTLLNFDRSLAKEKDEYGETALHLAARDGQTEAIQILLNFDRSLAKEKDDDGNTALHLAALNGQTEALQTLLDFERSLAKEKDNAGWTALDLAIELGQRKCKKLLEDYEAQPSGSLQQ